MKSARRIAVGSIFTECNHFGGRPTDLADFERQELRRGAEVLGATTGTVGGMLAVLAERQADAAPLVVASACPGGPLTADCYAKLKTELLDRLRAALPLDGVLLALHGSASAEGAGDLEGDLLAAIRELVGAVLPVVATLDLHAHVTAEMVGAADALVAWETYPHRDAYETGSRGARLLIDVIDGKLRPAMAMAKVPVLVGGVNGHTEGPGPFADVMRFAKMLEGHEGVVSTSAFLVHPYLDLPEMGGGGLVITDGDMHCAVTLARRIAQMFWERRFELDPPVYTPVDAIELGRQVEGGPVLLVETADCCGGGAAGDSIATLRALLDARVTEPALVPVVDPVAAAMCHRANVGARLTLEIGHHLDPRWGRPIDVTGDVLYLGDGRFRYTGGIWDGHLGEMGPSAVLAIGPVRVLITTHATYDWADEQYRAVGLDPRSAKFVVVKNPMNYRLGYAGLYRAAMILDTPGPTPAVLHHVRYGQMPRLYYPADREITGLEPVVLRGRRHIPKGHE